MHETYCDYVCSLCISIPRHLKGITNTEATQAPSIGTEYKVRLKEFSFDLWSSLLTSLLPPPHTQPPPPPPKQQSLPDEQMETLNNIYITVTVSVLIVFMAIF